MTEGRNGRGLCATPGSPTGGAPSPWPSLVTEGGILFWAVRGRGRGLGCSFVGLLWVPGCWWSPGERFAACSVCAACSVGALWPVACQGRDTPGGSAAPARPLQGRPPRVRHGCDTGRAGLLSPSPDGVGQSSSFTRRTDGAPSGSGPHKTGMPRIRLAELNVATPMGGRLRRSEVLRERLRDHWRRSRGHDALSDMSDGVYGLLRPHDHGMPGVILDTGSDSVPLWGCALLCTPLDGGWRRGYRRSTPPVGCR